MAIVGPLSHSPVPVLQVCPPGQLLVPAQTPPPHTSLLVQATPSSHDEVLLAFWQPEAGTQVSVVHTLPSLQLGAAPPTQVPPAQVSLVVQALPSVHGAVLFVY